ncbi:MAG: DNA starvation/stationary phase protection protein [Coxiellaceae bacterium]|nr:MAG: DNA starvation/stationary phase protection protein [Coxiellaceae bacterium]
MSINIGINEQGRQEVAKQLAKLLANTYALYLKTQNFHWNVTGEHFYSLHKLFEEQYTALAEAIDEIAERIRALGHPAPASFTEFLKLMTIKEAAGKLTAKAMIEQLVADNETLSREARGVFPAAEAANDEATADLVTIRMAEHEKAAWMLRSLVE